MKRLTKFKLRLYEKLHDWAERFEAWTWRLLDRASPKPQGTRLLFNPEDLGEAFDKTLSDLRMNSGSEFFKEGSD